MAVKKSDLYASLWASCDELRGGMDASLYKDYVLFMLFIKYVSDKYADSEDYAPPIVMPKGSSFKDMIALKGKPDIGEKINTDIIKPLIEANPGRLAHSDFPDFNDPNLLGEGQAMVDRLSNLVGIFQKKELNFASNRAEHDDILGDAYEYLMRHFATESGKSKGQFYTPSEVSRVIAKVIGIAPANTVAATTAYDPTCGSGSLLLKVAAEAGKHITLEGQEKDVTTAGLARMNMILHDFPTASILSGNTLASPKFKDGERLRSYDYVVANPPFSDKTWSTGLTPANDPHQRFAWGVPPAKQGDYAYLLHIIRSMKRTGKGACILPHGVLFRGNAEGTIRRQLVASGILKGIIGLPANLFYGTGIPTCILVLDKDNAAARKGIFMVDASKGFMKDGNKNRLRERDIHQIVDVFTHAEEHPGYSRLVPVEEIQRNDYNLNLPRYIDSQQLEDIQDLGAHLHGGIPERDIDALSEYWQRCPDLRAALFAPRPAGQALAVGEAAASYAGKTPPLVPGAVKERPGYLHLQVPITELKASIHCHPQFSGFIAGLAQHFAQWRSSAALSLRTLAQGCHPKDVIHEHAEALLAHAESQPLIDPYAIYQHLMDFWATTMQDDVYVISADGWIATPARIVETDKKGKTRDKGWTCELIPKPLIVARYYAREQAAIEARQTELEATSASLAELEEEHSIEDAAFAGFDKINAASVKDRIKEIDADGNKDEGSADEITVLKQWLKLNSQEAALKKAIRDADAALDTLAHDHYAKLSETEIKTLVVDDKWLSTLSLAVQAELDRVSQTLTSRIRLLADRYAAPLPQLVDEVAVLAARVEGHLKKMEIPHA